MQNIKQKVLGLLQNEQNAEPVLNDLSNCQDNLLKNFLKSVFNKEDKNEILKQYNNLNSLGKNLYRYNNAKENNNNVAAEKNKQNAENILLKGGISYNRYIWHSENGEHTCDECKALDGKIFDFYEEVPDPPHPNCKCWVEIIENKKEKPVDNQEKNEEPCDALKQIEDLISGMEDTIEETNSFSDNIQSDIEDIEKDITKIQNLISENDLILENLEEEYGKHFPNCENNIDKEYIYLNAKINDLQVLLNKTIDLLNNIFTFLNTIRIFASNYLVLLYKVYILKEKEIDKYYHSKANCEATQELGVLGEEAAQKLSDLKEKFDQYTYVHTHKVTIEEAIADSERDQIANRLGRERGRKYPDCKCSELMQDLLPQKYKK